MTLTPDPMSNTNIETRSLNLVLDSLENARAQVDAMSETDKAQLSADWLALLGSATSADPWVLGFQMVRRDNEVIVGQCGFKGPPTPDGVVEIAYAVERESEGNGYATEAAQAVLEFAFTLPNVAGVWSVTDPDNVSSARVLERLGMQLDYRGEFDQRDSLVYRLSRDHAR